MHPLDHYRCAKLLLDQHGPQEAWRHATARAIDLHMADDEAGRVAWQAILKAMHELTQVEPDVGQGTH